MNLFLSGEPPVVLCLATSADGADFLQELHAHGCSVVLLTTEALARGEYWPRDAISYLHAMPSLAVPLHVVNAASWLARSHAIVRIVALDDRDLGVVALLREHLCLEGMGTSATRPLRDRLTLRMMARSARLPVPQFSGLFHDEEVRGWVTAVPPPWLLKPREASAGTDNRRVESEAELWAMLVALGDERSRYLIERVVTGEYFHATVIVAEGRVLCMEVDARSEQSLDRRAISELTERLARTLGPGTGPLRVECVRAEDGRHRLLEVAGRMGPRHVVQLVEATSGVNLWREWARAEIANMKGESYTPANRLRQAEHA